MCAPAQGSRTAGFGDRSLGVRDSRALRPRRDAGDGSGRRARWARMPGRRRRCCREVARARRRRAPGEPPRLGAGDERRTRNGEWRRSALALQPRLRPCGGFDPGARDADLARARWRRPARRDRRRRLYGRGARRLRAGAVPGVALGRRRGDRRGRVRGPARRLRRGDAVTLARDGLAGRHSQAPRHGGRRGDRRRMAGRPLADRSREGMGTRPADRRAARPRLCRRAGGTRGRGRHRRVSRCATGAGSWPACWSSPSG